MPDQIIGRAPGNRRPRLLSREVGGGSGRNRRHPGGHGKDAHVLRTQKIVGIAEGTRNRTRLAMNAIKQEEAPQGDVEALLPWHAAGTLSRRDAQRVEEALARDPELARRYDLVREELGETIHLNETLGAPSARAMEKLFAKIDAEPARKPARSFSLGARVSEWFASLTPRTLALSASVAVLAILLQAGFIADVVLKDRSAEYGTASAPTTDPGVGEFTLIRFAPQASADDITKFLAANKLQVAAGPVAGGFYRVRVADTKLPKEELGRIVKKLQDDKVVNFIATVQ